MARVVRAAPHVQEVVASPVVKWVGGKTRLLPDLLARIPERFGRYYEPFAGGAALFFRLAPKRAVLADANHDLIGLYTAIAKDVGAVIRRLEIHREAHSEAHYYEMRARWNDREVSWSTPERAAAFIYLNKTCFNGLWRVNRKGEFNVPFGKYTNPTICDEENLRAVSLALQDAVITSLDFEKTTLPAKRGDVAYFDPPYVPVSATANFTAYTAGGFGFEDQVRLRDVAMRLDARGVHVLLSNADVPLVRELYKGFRVEEVQAPRRVNSKGGKRGNVGEVLISGRGAK